MSQIKFVIKRSGAKVPFKPERIMNAIYKAAVSLGESDKSTAENLSEEVETEQLTLIRQLPEKSSSLLDMKNLLNGWNLFST